METTWASLVSYGMTVAVLQDFLPVDDTLSITTVRTNTLAVAQRCEAELGEEQWSFITGHDSEALLQCLNAYLIKAYLLVL